MTFFTRAILLSTLVISTCTQAQTAQINPTLLPYTKCKFDDGLAIVEKSALPPGVEGRTVDTIAGPRNVPLLRGERIMFSYPATDFFANVKAEQLPADAFDQGRKDLIANFDHILAAGDESSRNMTYALHPTLNGFEVYGLDRKKLEGSTIGMYLLIDSKTAIVTSVYFLNQGPARRRFATLEEYATLRDHFLNAYTTCIHGPHVAPVAKPRPTSKKRRH